MTLGCFLFFVNLSSIIYIIWIKHYVRFLSHGGIDHRIFEKNLFLCITFFNINASNNPNTERSIIWMSICVATFEREKHFTNLCNSCFLIMYCWFTEIDIQQCVKESIQVFCNTPKSAAYRQHARQVKKKVEEKPNLSYYSRDYNDQPSNELVCVIVVSHPVI